MQRDAFTCAFSDYALLAGVVQRYSQGERDLYDAMSHVVRLKTTLDSAIRESLRLEGVDRPLIQDYVSAASAEIISRIAEGEVERKLDWMETLFPVAKTLLVETDVFPGIKSSTQIPERDAPMVCVAMLPYLIDVQEIACFTPTGHDQERLLQWAASLMVDLLDDIIASTNLREACAYGAIASIVNGIGRIICQQLIESSLSITPISPTYYSNSDALKTLRELAICIQNTPAVTEHGEGGQDGFLVVVDEIVPFLLSYIPASTYFGIKNNDYLRSRIHAAHLLSFERAAVNAWIRAQYDNHDDTLHDICRKFRENFSSGIEMDGALSVSPVNLVQLGDTVRTNVAVLTGLSKAFANAKQ